nr:hypothetical protein [Raineyella fluvialis]
MAAALFIVGSSVGGSAVAPMTRTLAGARLVEPAPPPPAQPASRSARPATSATTILGR